MTPAERQTKDQIEGKIRERLKTGRITREMVDRQVAEMYSVIDGLAICVDVDQQDYVDCLERAREIEAELRARLEAQDRLDRAAPALLDACKRNVAVSSCDGLSCKSNGGADHCVWCDTTAAIAQATAKG